MGYRNLNQLVKWKGPKRNVQTWHFTLWQKEQGVNFRFDSTIEVLRQIRIKTKHVRWWRINGRKVTELFFVDSSTHLYALSTRANSDDHPKDRVHLFSVLFPLLNPQIYNFKIPYNSKICPITLNAHLSLKYLSRGLYQSVSPSLLRFIIC